MIKLELHFLGAEEDYQTDLLYLDRSILALKLQSVESEKELGKIQFFSITETDGYVEFETIDLHNGMSNLQPQIVQKVDSDGTAMPGQFTVLDVGKDSVSGRTQVKVVDVDVSSQDDPIVTEWTDELPQVR